MFDLQVDEDFDLDADGVTTCAGDCDDADPRIYPGAPEVCDGVDNDCDLEVDEGFDADADGVTTCENDCNDNNPLVHPGAPEVCGNGIDDNCDGQIDENVDRDADGVASCDGDCDDSDARAYPGATEECDGIDNDCNGAVDEGFDADGDGVSSCAGDCNDSDPLVFPEAAEVCDGVDNDCNGEVDDGFDADYDGVPTCAGDCDDDDPLIHPGALEVCGDGIDSDCDGADTACTSGVQDAFQCWKVKDLKNPKFEKDLANTATDGLGGFAVEVVKPFLVCGPADLNAGGIADPDGVNGTHLCCYKVNADPKKPDPPSTASISPTGVGANLGAPQTTEVELKLRQLLCVPCNTSPLP